MIREKELAKGIPKLYNSPSQPSISERRKREKRDYGINNVDINATPIPLSSGVRRDDRWQEDPLQHVRVPQQYHQTAQRQPSDSASSDTIANQ